MLTDARPSSRREQNQRGPRNPPRRDIQGLRAFAVLVVFLDHLFGWPTGGFVGVDMFFVISGFLITGLLLREYEKTGTISFRKFYIARAKRIIPAATLTLIVTALLGFVVFAGNRAISITWDAVWAFLFSANWNFAAKGTEYFDQGGPVSPLQHYWSLSVEEQFYFVWPWLLLVLLYLFARFGPMTSAKVRVIAGTTIALITVASFTWAGAQATAEPTFAYFSTFTRAWELGLGALLAVLAPLFVKLNPVFRTVLAYVGLTGMVISCFTITPTTVWPAPWALLPTLATGAVIASGIGTEARYLSPLTNRVAVYIGDISYSLYLWHFPAIIFGLALYPNAGSLGYVGVIIAGFGLAIGAYYAVERPIHKSPLWSVRGTDARRAWDAWRDKYGRPAQYGLLAGLCFLIVPVLAIAFLPPATSQAETVVVPPAPTAATDAPDSTPEQTALTASIVDALNATSWPAEFDAQVGVGGGLDQEYADCADPATAPREGCQWGAGAKTAIVVGDSIASAYLPTLRAVLEPAGWSVRSFAMNGCEFSSLDLTSGGAAERCGERKADAVAAIESTKPQAVFVATQFSVSNLTGSTENVPFEEWQAGFSSQLDLVKPHAGRTIIVTPPPYEKQITDCYTAVAAPADCVSTPTEGYELRADAVSKLAADNVAILPSAPWFCYDGKCPPFVGGTLTKADTVHPNQPYMRQIQLAVVEAMNGVLPPA